MIQQQEEHESRQNEHRQSSLPEHFVRATELSFISFLLNSGQSTPPRSTVVSAVPDPQPYTFTMVSPTNTNYRT